MNLDAFISAAVDAGLRSIQEDPRLQRHPKRMEGSRKGFEACRGMSAAALRVLLDVAKKDVEEERKKYEKARLASRDVDIEDYWRARYFEVQVDWICNTVSAFLSAEGLPTIVEPTARGAINAAKIVASMEESP